MGAGRAGGAEVVADIPRPDSFLLHGRPDGFLLHGKPDGSLLYGRRDGFLLHGLPDGFLPRPDGFLFHSRPDGFLLHGRLDGFLLHGRPDGFLPGDGRWQGWQHPSEGPGAAGRAPDGPEGNGRLSAALRRRPIARTRHGGHATATETPC